MEPRLIVDGLVFYDAPGYVESSPYSVDLWASVNGYRIGLQVKPRTYNSSSKSIYAPQIAKSQKRGLELFREAFGGRAFIAVVECGEIELRVKMQILEECKYLMSLPKGKLDDDIF